MKKNIIMLFILMSLLNVYGLKGSGNMITEDRELSKFHTISLNCNAKVTVKKSNNNSAIIKADDNVMSSIQTEVKRGELLISLKGIVTESTIEIELSTEDIDNLNVNGQGSIKVNDQIEVDNLGLKIIGKGSIVVASNSKFVFSKIFGNGYIDIGGSTDMHEMELSGGGIIKALTFEANKSKVNISGEGICQINVIDELEIKVGGVGGNGIIEYNGKPKIQIDVFGAANIKSLE